MILTDQADVGKPVSDTNTTGRGNTREEEEIGDDNDDDDDDDDDDNDDDGGDGGGDETNVDFDDDKIFF
ncbi:hypothetical protein PoB_005016900 [Plakobranchus ocellatus]|uniref:Uncharacterized protein n=1 Tax=Plakobranchus ocellatus TaxID=259542 RepID=A0AAV4BXX0_9GAST|nr:hypothetical protein PoB_005016900 [Plakobranchus ocellatus]